MKHFERKVIYSEISSDHSYQEVWDLQKHLQAKIIANKRNGIRAQPGYLLFCEHPPVYTLGKSGKIEHLRMSEADLSSNEIEFFKINRGGDITYHGPGQITGYPILDLDQYYNDLHRYVRELEEAVIQCLNEYGIKGIRIPEFTGVWIEDERGQRKICAIGIHMSRWVSMHGFALNVKTELSKFKGIVPCGIQEEQKSVTSIEQELGHEVNVTEVRQLLAQKLSSIFQFTLIEQGGSL